MIREEHNLPLTKESFEHLIKKSDGNIISKTRHLIPYSYIDSSNNEVNVTIELDVFSGSLSGLYFAEVEFSSEEEALSFVPPSFFTKEVTNDSRYQNSNLIYGEPRIDEMC